MSSGVLAQRVGQETVLLHLATERYYGLDETATAMWEALLGAATIGEALEHLLARYDVDPERLQRDLMSLIEELRADGLVDVAD
jgi:hypothetical protein